MKHTRKRRAHASIRHGGQPVGLAALLAAQPEDVHAYCCSPLPMLAAFEAACAASGIA